MPVTPFHFGPGLLLKGIAPRHFSWIAFAAAQVVIDCETVYFLVRQEYPVHRTLHTFVGATLAGVVTAVVLLGLVGGLRASGPGLLRALEQRWAWLRAELCAVSLLAGGAVGGFSHPLLDGIMHADVRPLLPWSVANPLLGFVGVGALHLGCAGAALVGVAILWWRAPVALRPDGHA